jgi:hypothetical protein
MAHSRVAPSAAKEAIVSSEERRSSGQDEDDSTGLDEHERSRGKRRGRDRYDHPPTPDRAPPSSDDTSLSGDGGKNKSR